MTKIATPLSNAQFWVVCPTQVAMSLLSSRPSQLMTPDAFTNLVDGSFGGDEIGVNPMPATFLGNGGTVSFVQSSDDFFAGLDDSPVQLMGENAFIDMFTKLLTGASVPPVKMETTTPSTPTTPSGEPKRRGRPKGSKNRNNGTGQEMFVGDCWGTCLYLTKYGVKPYAIREWKDIPNADGRMESRPILLRVNTAEILADRDTAIVHDVDGFPGFLDKVSKVEQNIKVAA